MLTSKNSNLLESSRWPFSITVLIILFSDTLLLAVEELGSGEHGLRGLPVQADHAEQDATGVGRLRGRELGQVRIPEVC